MASTKRTRLGEREMDLMQALWKLGKATVSEVQAELQAQGEEIAYTTIQTMLNRLEAKGQVARDTSDRAHYYRPRMREPSAVSGAIQTLIDRFFGGSAEALAAHLVEKKLREEDLDRLQSLIEEHRQKEKSK